jgi:shikimate dehydrogenase
MKNFFGIVGNPVEHSLSPLLHNYWLKKYDIDAIYSIIKTEEDGLSDVVKRIKEGSLSGINVTLPYKQKIINHIDQIINDAKLTGSVNTLLLEKNTVVGENTDVFGLQAAYLKKISDNINKKALVIGAGGVAPSVILSLEKSGVKYISIVNRTYDKCLFLKKNLVF